MADAVHTQLIEAVRTYHIPPEATALLTAHKPLVIVGATGSGKDAITDYVESSSQFREVVTHTTRPPRHDDQNGINYWFVNKAQMLRLLNGHQMIEAKLIHGDTVYGISIGAYKKVIADGYNPILVIDVHGVEDISKHVPGLQAAFILPPSFEVWMERLDKRGHMSHVEKARRLQSAKAEIEHVLRSRHFNLYVNRDVHIAAQEILRGAVIPSEQHHNRELAQQLLDHIRAY
jgi:guanylate kinase